MFGKPLIFSIVWPDERGKRYCAYGTLHEDDAEAAFGATLDTQKNKINQKGAELLDWRAQHLGLYVCKAPGYGFLGMSPAPVGERTSSRCTVLF